MNEEQKNSWFQKLWPFPKRKSPPEEYHHPLIYTLGIAIGIGAAIFKSLFDLIRIAYAHIRQAPANPSATASFNAHQEAEKHRPPPKKKLTWELKEEFARLMRMPDFKVATEVAKGMRLTVEEVRELLGPNHPVLHLFGDRHSRIVGFPDLYRPRIYNIDKPNALVAFHEEGAILSECLLWQFPVEEARRRAEMFGISSPVFEMTWLRMLEAYIPKPNTFIRSFPEIEFWRVDHRANGVPISIQEYLKTQKQKERDGSNQRRNDGFSSSSIV